MSTSSPPINIDDGDIDDILYQPVDLWIHQKNEPDYQAGTHSRGFTNAYAEFKFNGSLGTDIAVYGVALPNPQLNNDGSTIAATIPPSARFSIDGGIPLTVVSNPDLQEAEYAHQFYDSHTLPTGEHVLQMNVTYGTAEWPFVLDYIQYTPLQAQPPSVGQGASAGGSAGASKPRVPSVAIGASVAGVMLVLAIAALFRYWNHLSRRRKCGIRTSPKEKVDRTANVPRVCVQHGRTELLRAHIFSEARYELCPTADPTRPPSPTDSHSDISSHAGSESRHGHRFGRQLPPTPITPFFSDSTGTRPARPSTADSSQPLLPPAPVHHRPSTLLPPIVWGAATPDSAQTAETSQPSKARKAGILHAGPKGKQPTFHADSGVRFSYGEMPPVRPALVRVLANPDSASSHVSDEEEGREKERNRMKLKEKKEKLKRNVSYGGSAISEVPPMYTEA